MVVYATGHYVAYPGLAIFVLTFDIALHSRDRVAVATLFASAVVIGVAVDLQPDKVAILATYVESELGILVAWLTGRNLRHRRARWAELTARTERAEREREEEARRAVTEERLRIARELHDVIAHSMSVIAVQAGVGNHVIDTQPGEARQALAAIEATSRCRAHRDAPAARRAARRTANRAAASRRRRGWPTSPALAGQVQDAGLKVWINVDGQRRDLPPGIDLSAYRIVQEALTNVLKHGGAGRRRRHDQVPPGLGDRGGHRRRRGRAAGEGPGSAGRLRARAHRHAGAGGGVRRRVQRRARARRRLPGAAPASRSRRLTVVIRVLVADDQALVRGGFRVLVDSAPDLEVVGEAGDGAEAVALARQRTARRRADGHPDAASGRARGDPA